MITASAGLLGAIRQNAKFAYGVAPLPYYKDIAGAPQNTVIGGASLWVLSGRPADHYKGIAEFFNYLSRPKSSRRATSTRATCRSRRPPTS